MKIFNANNDVEVAPKRSAPFLGNEMLPNDYDDDGDDGDDAVVKRYVKGPSARMSRIVPITKSLCKNHCKFLLPMLGWLCSNSLVNVYAKYVNGAAYIAFPCPLLLSSVQVFFVFIFSYFATKVFPGKLGGYQVDALPWDEYWRMSIPCGVVAAASVAFGNLALVRITMTFYTMIMSSAPIFVILSAYLFGLQKVTPVLIMTVSIVSVGELLTVVGEVTFDLIGFICVMLAAVFAGTRLTVIQRQLRSVVLNSTFATMRVILPVTAVLMLLVSCIFEKPWTKFGSDRDAQDKFFDTPFDALQTLGMAVFGAILLFIYVICEFYLVMHASAVILMIGGVMKELSSIMVGVVFMGDHLNPINILGMVVVFTGLLFFKMSLLHSGREIVDDSVKKYEMHSSLRTVIVDEIIEDFDNESVFGNPGADNGKNVVGVELLALEKHSELNNSMEEKY